MKAAIVLLAILGADQAPLPPQAPPEQVVMLEQKPNQVPQAPVEEKKATKAGEDTVVELRRSGLLGRRAIIRVAPGNSGDPSRMAAPRRRGGGGC